MNTNKSESIAELATALSAAQAEMGPAKMSATNPFLKNKYADLGEIIQAAKPALTKHGLSYSQHPITTAGKIGVETFLMHKSGEWMSSSIELELSENEKGRSLAQNAGAIITYLRRYSLAAIIGIYADEDVDGDGQPGGNGKEPAKSHAAPPTKAEGKKAEPKAETTNAPAANPPKADEKPGTEAWKLWNELRTEAISLGLEVEELPATVKLDELRLVYKDLLALVKDLRGLK